MQIGVSYRLISNKGNGRPRAPSQGDDACQPQRVEAEVLVKAILLLADN
jgi:hypothetical protein